MIPGTTAINDHQSEDFPVGMLNEYSGLSLDAAFDKLLELDYFQDIASLAKVDLIRSQLNLFITRVSNAISGQCMWEDLTKQPRAMLGLRTSLTPTCKEDGKITILYNCVYVLALWLNPQVSKIYQLCLMIS